jgi:ureidoglycolate lyase
MKTYRLNLKPLTGDSFAPFGDVIQKQGHYPEEINYGQTRKYANLAGIDTTDEGGETAVHIYRSRPVSLPFKIKVMECHPLGSQAFVPLHNRPFLVVVAPPAEQLDFKSIQGFFTNGEQGVNLHKGVWHHYQLSLEEISDYLVIDRSGPGNNRVEHHLEKTLFIEELLN